MAKIRSQHGVYGVRPTLEVNLLLETGYKFLKPAKAIPEAYKWVPEALLLLDLQAQFPGAAVGPLGIEWVKCLDAVAHVNWPVL